jgi:hypothetical protein
VSYAPLSEVVEQFAADHAHLADPWLATDQCAVASEAFALRLREAGIAHAVVSGLHTVDNVILYGHFAVRIKDEVWDWTYRQFDHDSPWPRVTDVAQWYDEWSHVTERVEA